MDKGKRSATLDLERELVEKDPGKLNRKDWAGTKKGQPWSKRAQRACEKKK